MPKVKNEILDMIRTALKEDRGSVARAIKLCKENGVSPKMFGRLLDEGWETTVVDGKPVHWLYDYRVGGQKVVGKVMPRKKYETWKYYSDKQKEREIREIMKADEKKRQEIAEKKKEEKGRRDEERAKNSNKLN